MQEDKRKCEKCGDDYSKNKIASHRRACTEREGESGELCGPVGPRGRKSRGLVCTEPSGVDARTVGK